MKAQESSKGGTSLIFNHLTLPWPPSFHFKTTKAGTIDVSMRVYGGVLRAVPALCTKFVQYHTQTA